MRRVVRSLFLALALTVVPAATAAAHPAVSAVSAVSAAGAFGADLDFATLTATPAANGNHCELSVQGTLTFTGTLDGDADGTTTAYVLAPCEEVLAAPPGTYRDVFRFTGSFVGTVAGTPATGKLAYAGVTRSGGSIDAVIRLSGTSTALLRAEAMVAEGGTYVGVAQP